MMKPKLLTSRVNPIILFLFQNTVDWTCPLHDHNIHDQENEREKEKKRKDEDVCLSSISKLRCNNVFSHVSIIVGSDVSLKDVSNQWISQLFWFHSLSPMNESLTLSSWFCSAFCILPSCTLLTASQSN